MGPSLMDGTWIYGGEMQQIAATVLQGRPNGMPSFRGRALVFWWAMLERRPRAPGPAFAHLFVTSIHASLLGALFLFAPRPWYPRQTLGAPAWGLSPLQDQQLGGLVMWLVACFVYVVAALWILAGWIRRARPREIGGHALAAR